MAARNYKKEYKKFQSTDEQKKKRAARNKARRKALKKGTVTKGDKNDISHVKDKNGKVKTVVKPRSKNRGSKKDMPGDKRARGKGCKRKKRK